MPVTKANGQELFYEDTGGDGPPVVFSHGFAMDHHMWDAQVEALRTEFRCITWDQRAHGATVDDDQPFSYWDSAADLLGLMDALDLPSASLVGLSQGGFLSMRAALRAPDRVRALAILSSRAGIDAQEVLDGFAGLKAEWTTNGPENVKHGVAGMLIGDATLHDEAFARWATWDRGKVARSIDALTDRDDLTNRVAEITAPALVVHGEADAAIPFAVGEELSRQLGKVVHFAAIAGAGHAPNLTHADDVTALLQDFLRTYGGEPDRPAG